MISLRNILYYFKHKSTQKSAPDKYKQFIEDYHQTDLHTIMKDTVEYFIPYQNSYVYYVLPLSFIQWHNTSLDDIIKLDKKFNDTATGVFGLGNDGLAKVVISDSNGYIFRLAISRHQDTYDLTFWDTSGFTHLYNLQTKNNVLTYAEINKIKKVLENYSHKGLINCSDCKNEMFKNEIAGRYFAGVYCKKCWDGKWKAIEAKETYD